MADGEDQKPADHINISLKAQDGDVVQFKARCACRRGRAY